MNFNELKHEDDFKKWLPENGVKSVTSYTNGLKSIQRRYELHIEDAIKNGTKDLELRFTPEMFNNNLRLVRNAKSHVRKYYKYLNDK